MSLRLVRSLTRWSLPLLLIGVTWGGCARDEGGPSAGLPGPDLGGSDGGPSDGQALGQIVRIRDGKPHFDPAEVHTWRGGTVTWVYSGGMEHDVVFGRPIDTSSKTPDPLEFTASAIMTRTLTFGLVDSFTYRCTIHDIQGTVIVHEAAS